MDETTAEAGTVEPPRPRGGEPALVLAFTGDGRRAVERCGLPASGVLLGRDVLVFPGGVLADGQLSRRHAEVRREAGRFVLRDLASRNGTFVNGRRLDAPHALAPGDVIRIGRTLLVYAVLPDDDERIAPSLIGPSEAMAAARRAVVAAAGARHTVLVTGETGTGKEVVAQALHAASRRPGRFVAVNCGALSEGTLASELFGHVKGAFTDATADRPGLFRAADGGTLLLDEIGDLPPPLQVKLLRTLETRQVRPVGGTAEIAVDVLVAAATNRDLAGDVRAARFRADLYGRLSQWVIHLPPLRERREDLPSLTRHLLARLDAADRAMSPALAEALLLHPWPLNVRGLVNVLAVAARAGGRDSPLDLRPEVEAVLAANRAIVGDEPERPPAGEPTREQLADALTRFHGQVAAAARHLGGTRQQLYRWARKHGLDPQRFRPG